LIAILGTGQRRQQHQSYILYSSCGALKNLPSPDSKSCIQHSTSLTHPLLPSPSLTQIGLGLLSSSPGLSTPSLILDRSHLHSTSFFLALDLTHSCTQPTSVSLPQSHSLSSSLYFTYLILTHSQSHPTRTLSPFLSLIQLLNHLPQAHSTTFFLNFGLSSLNQPCLLPSASFTLILTQPAVSLNKFSVYLIPQSIQSASLSVKSSELGTPQPLTRKRLSPPTPLGPRGATRLLAGEGVGWDNQFRDWRETLMLCILIPLRLILSRSHSITSSFTLSFPPSASLNSVAFVLSHTHFFLFLVSLTFILFYPQSFSRNLFPSLSNKHSHSVHF
jgi:hypothetical protein